MMDKWKKLVVDHGKPFPLGAIVTDSGINFAIISSHKKLKLSIFKERGQEPVAQFSMNSSEGNLHHIEVKHLPKEFSYAYWIPTAPGTYALDPYALGVNTSEEWGEVIEPILSICPQDTPFDWGNDTPPNIPFEELLIYEMHIRGFTKDPSSKVKHRGTFLGMIEKIPYLKELGINAVELLPVFEFDERSHPSEHLFNYWGYSTLNFFTPMNRYATKHGRAIKEFKKLVKALHQAGIEVILDVVFNHVADRDSMYHLAREIYYILDKRSKHTNYTGCGNTVNCNHPIVIQWILSVLRYWTDEMHVDGFRFDLASIFYRGDSGKVLHSPKILKAIRNDPVLSKKKLIAEPWDAAGLYQVGSFAKGWAEWNGNYRDVVRRFIKGTEGHTSAFAHAVSGSAGLFRSKKGPYESINFITAHDGFTLHDLVSYNEKHNEDNGENNQDGNSYSDSWNCGHEGPTDNPEILHLRNRQIRNFLVALSTSIGTPMFLMGDEYGHTRNGNNNTYCQDNEQNYFLWDAPNDLTNLFKQLIHFRKTNPVFQRRSFLKEEDITWHGHEPFAPNWDPSSRFVAYTLKNIYIAFNANYEWANITLPPPPEGTKWKRLLDTNLLNFEEDPQALEDKYDLPPYSSLILLAD